MAWVGPAAAGVVAVAGVADAAAAVAAAVGVVAVERGAAGRERVSR